MQTRAVSPARRQPRTARSWPAFERSLATAIASLDREFLVLDVKGTGLYVQVHAKAREGLRAEAVSNAWLSERDRLDPDRAAALTDLGWSPPTQGPEDTIVKGGSPNHFRDYPAPVPEGQVARLLVLTLSGPFHVRGPSGLAYRAFAASGGELQLPALGLAQRPAVPRREGQPARGPAPEPAEASVRRAVLAELRSGTADPDVDFDEDGDAVLDIDDVRCCVRVISNPLVVRVWSALDLEIPPDSDLLARIHEVNAQLYLARIIVLDAQAFVSADLPAAPFVPEHLRAALAAVGELAPAIDRALRAGAVEETKA
jgi:hypothetical protein